MNTKLRAHVEPDGRVRLSCRCVVTGRPYSVVVSGTGVRQYFAEGVNVAKAFPELGPEEREFLISGTSPEGWKVLFGNANAGQGREPMVSKCCTKGCANRGEPPGRLGFLHV
jgi:hypothetical protein